MNLPGKNASVDSIDCEFVDYGVIPVPHSVLYNYFTA